MTRNVKAIIKGNLTGRAILYDTKSRDQYHAIVAIFILDFDLKSNRQRRNKENNITNKENHIGENCSDK